MFINWGGRGWKKYTGVGVRIFGQLEYIYIMKWKCTWKNIHNWSYYYKLCKPTLCALFLFPFLVALYNLPRYRFILLFVSIEIYSWPADSSLKPRAVWFCLSINIQKTLVCCHWFVMCVDAMCSWCDVWYEFLKVKL